MNLTALESEAAEGVDRWSGDYGGASFEDMLPADVPRNTRGHWHIVVCFREGE